MEITEVRVKLMDEPGERLQAFCSITFDDAFVVRDLKIIEGATGPFVAMPSRKLTAHCPHCGCKNHLRAGYCNQCGTRCRDQQAAKDDDGRAKLYADIAHPINSACRELIQQRVIEAFREERRRSSQPGYVPSYEDFDVEAPSSAASSSTASSPAPAVADTAPDPVEKIPQVEPAQLQGAEKPRGPHKIAARESQAEPSDKSGFGAGIFE